MLLAVGLAIVPALVYGVVTHESARVLHYGQFKKKLAEREILSASGVALAHAIRHRRVTSRVVVETHINRARLVNPALNG